jgi:uncharacterized protein (DUF488 family)
MYELKKDSMLYYRRKILLALLETFGGKLTAKSLQKYLFLLTRGQEVRIYDFIPYKYGCFSFQANQDILTLMKYGYVDVAETPNGRYIRLLRAEDYEALLRPSDKELLRDVKTKFGSMSQNELIRYTYVKYPFYAIRSSIAQEILTTEEYKNVLAQEKEHTNAALFTIGYEGLTLEAYINKLILNGIAVLCDVRKHAYSQKYGFSKSQLQKACEGVNIEYVHIPDLGIESEYRQHLQTQQDYDELFRLYDETVLESNKTALERIVYLLKEKRRIALTCFEKNPIQCHRSHVAKGVLQAKDANYELINL